MFPQELLFNITKLVLRALVGHGVAVIGCDVAEVVGAMLEWDTAFVFDNFHVNFYFFLIGGSQQFMTRLVSGGLLQKIIAKIIVQSFMLFSGLCRLQD